MAKVPFLYFLALTLIFKVFFNFFKIISLIVNDVANIIIAIWSRFQDQLHCFDKKS